MGREEEEEDVVEEEELEEEEDETEAEGVVSDKTEGNGMLL